MRALPSLAERLRRSGTPGIVVPSAALPGTQNVVLFGPRVGSPYLLEPLGEVDVPASITAHDGRPVASLIDRVRFRGDAHAALEAWQRDEPYVFRRARLERRPPPSPEADDCVRRCGARLGDAIRSADDPAADALGQRQRVSVSSTASPSRTRPGGSPSSRARLGSPKRSRMRRRTRDVLLAACRGRSVVTMQRWRSA